jgi:GTP-binding protein
VITKLDLPDARAHFETLRAQIPELRGISAATGENIRPLLFEAYQTIQQTPAPTVVDGEIPRFVLTPDEPFEILVAGGGVFVVSGERIERLAAMTDFDSDESLFHFEQVLAKMGVEKRLLELGVREGDTVRVAQWEFTYS